MLFKVRAADPRQMAMREQMVEAANEHAARASLEAEGLVVLEVRLAKRAARPRAGAARMDFALFCQELRTLVRAGMTVVEGVETLCARDGAARRLPGLPEALRAKLQEGQALSQALASLPGAPAVLVAAVRAGERTSNLAEALDEYLRFDELVQRLRRKVVSAAVYPALVTALGIAITLFLLTVVMPSFARMYQNLRGRPTGFGGWMIELSLWVSGHQAAVLMAVVGIGVGLGIWVRRGGAAGALRKAALAIPAVRRRVEDFQLAMLYQALFLLLKGGYPMAQAMEIAGRSALGGQLGQGLATARDRILEGSLVSQALVSAGLCDEVDRRLMMAAERNGQFHLAAEVVSHLHGDRFELFVERVTRIVEPVLLLGVAILVGGIVVAMYMPVFDMATRLR